MFPTWNIVLKDRTEFIGKRSWKAIWEEALLETAYEVIDPLNSPFPKGVIVHLRIGSMFYRIKVK